MKLSQLEAAHINSVLKMTEGNRTRAAEILGISPVTLWRKLSDNKIV
jgi:DNA-binding protein Fis